MPIDLNETNHFPPLERRQQQVLEFLAWHRLRKHCYPYHKDIDIACHIGGSPAQILKALEKKGYLRLGAGKHRAMRITDQGIDYLSNEDLEKWDERATCETFADFVNWIGKHRILTSSGLNKLIDKSSISNKN